MTNPLLLITYPGHGGIALVRRLAVAMGSRFRAPHHTTSYQGIFGVKPTLEHLRYSPRPRKRRLGEWDLAGGGILLLDEAASFQRVILEEIRHRHESDAPTGMLVVLHDKPCPCGWYGHDERPCTCTHELVARHHARIFMAIPTRHPDINTGMGVVMAQVHGQVFFYLKANPCKGR
jgi:predicted ATPase with chaperone activity